MLKEIRIFSIILMITALGYISRTTIKSKGYYILEFLISNNSALVTMDNANGMSSPFSANTILREGNGILFMETTDRMDPPSLVLCAIESAARVYPDRPVAFFMKGLEDITTEEDEKRARQQFPTLSSYNNVYLFPLRMDKLFKNTPLKPWFDKGRKDLGRLSTPGTPHLLKKGIREHHKVRMWRKERWWKLSPQQVICMLWKNKLLISSVTVPKGLSRTSCIVVRI
ncbi:alpha-1,4-N-acetylglucosaminyltransferase-like isoform X2 [Aquarana catesbeiana]|uniref:alpha-1,4-N-acetylglucosaminyltransferase-like isoform X2 n=1 Tax=Aquarana catesbeiana TaxID=8400 RepID=UPI003CC95B92